MTFYNLLLSSSNNLWKKVNLRFINNNNSNQVKKITQIWLAPSPSFISMILLSSVKIYNLLIWTDIERWTYSLWDDDIFLFFIKLKITSLRKVIHLRLKLRQLYLLFIQTNLHLAVVDDVEILQSRFFWWDVESPAVSPVSYTHLTLPTIYSV